ncbi:hypothetical protein FOB82_10795 [Corynebacterium xerosis]|uniref:Uncharacterized protein n=1 Tax=Corynebacterium xerosis TaxID=1725 RepID=A0A6B8TH08_9CORY|nr:hypothetical protein [Corynebacterium xerosis]QGS35348.1 hypothetical protein FOB82_10795 [Corynebacterium xerosis]
MGHSFMHKSIGAKIMGLAAAATMTLGAAACSSDEPAEEAPADNPATTTETTDTTTPNSESGTREAPPAGESEAMSEPFTAAQGSTTITVTPGNPVPLNETMTVAWNSEGHASCGTILTLTTPDGMPLRFDPDAGCSGEFSESLMESLGATAGTWTLSLMGTPDGDIEVPIDVS